MTALPPPPPVIARAMQHKVPVVAALIPLAGVLGVIGVFTPWFKPTGTLRGQQVLEAQDALYSWEDGKIGLIAPILLAAAGLGVLGLLMGRHVSRFASHTDGPVIAASKSALLAGVVGGGALAVAWFLVPGQFDHVPFQAGGSWDGAEKLGIEMSRGPQLGFWCTAGAAGLALLGAFLTQVMHQLPAPSVTPGYGPPPAWAPPAAPGYAAPPSYGQPAYGQQPPYGQPAFGQQPPFGAPNAYSQPSYAPPADPQPLVYTPPPPTTGPNWQPSPHTLPGQQPPPHQDWQPLVYTPPSSAHRPPQ